MNAAPAALAVVLVRRFAWIAWPVLAEAQRRGLALRCHVVDEPADAAAFDAAVADGAIAQILYVTHHALLAAGGSAAVHARAAAGCAQLLWNVDSPAVTLRALPVGVPRCAVAHVCASDAAAWRQLAADGAPAPWTEGIGAHEPAATATGPFAPLAQRPIRVLVPFNLRWCSRTLDEIEAMAAALPAAARRVHEAAFERLRTDMAAAALPVLMQALAASGTAPADANLPVQLRLLVYRVHLWRRERVVAALLGLPVTIDSNELPARLTRGRRVRARLLADASPARTLERTCAAQAVVSVSFANDLLHDRALNAALLGAIGLVEANAAYRRHFRDGADQCWFDYADRDIGARVEALFDAPADALQAIADAGAARVRAGGIDHRFGGLYDTLAALAADGATAATVRGRTHHA